MKVTLTLPVLAPGTHRLTAVYRGTSPRVRLKSAMVDVTSVAGCAPQPSICGYPDASNTGPDPATVLRAVPGDVRQGQGWHWDDRGWVMVDGEGAVFSGFAVQAGVVVEADNATISNSVIDVGNEGWGVSLRNSNGVVISNNVIRGPSADQPCDNGIRDIYGNADGVQILANEIHLCASAINHFNQGGVIRGNFIHELGHECVSGDVDCGHFNGIQLGAGDGPTMTIDHNTIFNPAPATDAVMLANDDGPQTNRVITDNLLAGGGYTFYGSGGPEGEASNIIFKDNRFSTIFFAKGGSLGPVAHWQEGFGNEWSGNVWEDGPSAGKPVYP